MSTPEGRLDALLVRIQDELPGCQAYKKILEDGEVFEVVVRRDERELVRFRFGREERYFQSNADLVTLARYIARQGRRALREV